MGRLLEKLRFISSPFNQVKSLVKEDVDDKCFYVHLTLYLDVNHYIDKSIITISFAYNFPSLIPSMPNLLHCQHLNVDPCFYYQIQIHLHLIPPHFHHYFQTHCICSISILINHTYLYIHSQLPSCIHTPNIILFIIPNTISSPLSLPLSPLPS